MRHQQNEYDKFPSWIKMIYEICPSCKAYSLAGFFVKNLCTDCYWDKELKRLNLNFD